MADETVQKPTAGDGNALKLVADYGAKARVAAKRAKTAEDALGKANERIAELEKSAGKPSEKDQRIAELEGTIRVGKHRDRFRALAKKAGMNEGAIDDVFDLSGFKPEKDDVDDVALGKLIEAARTSRGYAFGKAGDPPPKGADGNPLDTSRQPAGQDRGGRNDGSDATVVTRADLANPKKMLDPNFRKAAAQAAKEGRLQLDRGRDRS